jgi:ankyrin repeat protein
MKKQIISVSALLSVLLSTQAATANNQPPALPPLPQVPSADLPTDGLPPLPELGALDEAEGEFIEDLPGLPDFDALVDEAKAEVDLEIAEDKVVDAANALSTVAIPAPEIETPALEVLELEAPVVLELADVDKLEVIATTPEEFVDEELEEVEESLDLEFGDVPEVIDTDSAMDQALEKVKEMKNALVQELAAVTEEAEQEDELEAALNAEAEAEKAPEIVEVIEAIEPEIDQPADLKVNDNYIAPDPEDELRALFAEEGLSVPDVAVIQEQVEAEQMDQEEIVNQEGSAESKRLDAVNSRVSERSEPYRVDNNFVIPNYMYTRSYSDENKHLPSVIYESDLDSNLVLMASAGDINALRALLNRGVNVNATNSGGSTALMAAVLQGQTDAVHLLILRGANVNVANKQGVTAMHVALDNNRIRLFRDLLFKGADVNAVSDNGTTTLMRAALSRNILAFKALLIKGADVEAMTPGGVSVLHIAAQVGSSEMISLLLKAGVTPNALTRSGVSAQELAMRSGYADTAEVLRTASQALVQEQQTLLNVENEKRLKQEAARSAKMAAMRAAEDAAVQAAAMAKEVAEKQQLMADHEAKIVENETLKAEALAEQEAEALEIENAEAEAIAQSAEMEQQRLDAMATMEASGRAAEGEMERQAMEQKAKADMMQVNDQKLELVTEEQARSAEIEIKRQAMEQKAKDDAKQSSVDLIEEALVEQIDDNEIEFVEDGLEEDLIEAEIERGIALAEEEIGDLEEATDEANFETVSEQPAVDNSVLNEEVAAIDVVMERTEAEVKSESAEDLVAEEVMIEEETPVEPAMAEILEEYEAVEEMEAPTEPVLAEIIEEFDAVEEIEAPAELAVPVTENVVEENSVADTPTEEFTILQADENSLYTTLGEVEKDVWDLRFANWLKVDGDFDNLTMASKLEWNKRHKMLHKTYGDNFIPKMHEFGVTDIDAVIARWRSLEAPLGVEDTAKEARRVKLNTILDQWSALNEEFHQLSLDDKISANNARHKMMGKLLDYESDSELSDVFEELSETRRQEVRASMIKWDSFEREIQKSDALEQEESAPAIDTEILPGVLPDAAEAPVEAPAEDKTGNENFYVGPEGDLFDEPIDAQYEPSAGGDTPAAYGRQQQLDSIEQQLQQRAFKPNTSRDLSRMEAIHGQPTLKSASGADAVSPTYLVDKLDDLLSAL